MSRTPAAATAVVIVLLTLAAAGGCGSGSSASDAAPAASRTGGAGASSPSGGASGASGAAASATAPAPAAATPATSLSSGSPSSFSSPAKPTAASSSKKPAAPATSASAPPAGGARPPSGNWPNAANTGVKPGSHLVAKKGEILITQNNAVLENIDLVGDIRVEADNVTIRNVRVTAPRGGGIDQWGILQWVGSSGLTVEDSEIIGNSDTELRQAVMNPGGMITVLRCNIHGMSKKGVYSSQGDIEDNYIHDPYWFAAADGEIEMVRVDGTPDNGLSLLVKHNTLIDTNTRNNAVGLYAADGGQPTRATIEGNYMATVVAAIYGGGPTAGTSYIVVKDNVFATKFEDGYGPVTEWNPNGRGNVWTGNMMENGKPAPLTSS